MACGPNLMAINTKVGLAKDINFHQKLRSVMNLIWKKPAYCQSRRNTAKSIISLTAENGDKPNDTDVRNFTYNESTLGLNVKYGYKVYKFIPYVTAGIGYTTIESENNFRSGNWFWETPATTENMSWNVGVGIEVPVTDNVAFNIAYKYTDLGSVEYTNGMFHVDHKTGLGGMKGVFDSDVDLYKHEIIAGVKMSF